jgi:hypothetical protein
MRIHLSQLFSRVLIVRWVAAGRRLAAARQGIDGSDTAAWKLGIFLKDRYFPTHDRKFWKLALISSNSKSPVI